MADAHFAIPDRINRPGSFMAIYKARFLKNFTGPGIADTKSRKVWAFLGYGETDEPESIGAISLAVANSSTI